MLILTEKDLREVLSMREVIGAVEAGFRALAQGDVVAPERLRMDIAGSGGVLLEMPASARLLWPGDTSEFQRKLGALGTKIVSVFETNADRGLDMVQAVYLLLNHATGVPLALMEGRFITGIRTSATSAVATKHLASPGPKHLAIFGAGVQARFHIEAMMEVAPVTRIMIASRTRRRANALAEHTRARHSVPCEVVSADEAAAEADLICTCTSAATPLFDGGLLKPGAHVNAVGAFTPSTRELDTETVKRARVIIDAESAAGREAGDILIPLSEGAIDAAHIKGTLADVVSGKVSGRESRDEITVFKSCGLAIEDLVTAQLAYANAIARNIGQRVAL